MGRFVNDESRFGLSRRKSGSDAGGNPWKSSSRMEMKESRMVK